MEAQVSPVSPNLTMAVDDLFATLTLTKQRAALDVRYSALIHGCGMDLCLYSNLGIILQVMGEPLYSHK